MKVYKKIQSKDLTFRHYELSYKEKEISPWIEFIRYHAVREIMKEISSSLDIPKNKALDMIKGFIYMNMESKIKKREIRDAVFPYDGEYSEEMKKQLKGFDLKKKMNDWIIWIENFYSSSLFEKIKKSYQYKIRNEKDLIYWDLDFESLKTECKDKDCIPHDIDFKMTLHITSFVYQKLQYQYNLYLKKHPHSYSFEQLCISLILRYETVDASNEQLACSPEFYHDMKLKYNFNFELFGSAFNTQYTYFGSFFDDIEKYFMSQGPYQSIQCISGHYVANPPFIEKVIYDFALYIEDQFVKSHNKKPLSFFITIPAWKSNEEYGEYRGFEMMKKSKYLTYFKEIPQNEARFYDYLRNKIVYPCGIFFLLLQNQKDKNYLTIEKLIHQHFRPFKRNIDLHYQPSPSIYQI